MTTTYTASSTFTITHARYIASKIAADLFQMQLFYGKPTHDEINNYVEEAITLFLGGFLDSVEYGFMKDGQWLVALRYKVQDGTIADDNRSGRVPYGIDISGARWYSYLRRTSAYWNLSHDNRESLEQSLPIKRSSASEPQTGNGAWVIDKYYSSGGVSVQRENYQKF